MTFIKCEEEHCSYNRSGCCGKESISIVQRLVGDKKWEVLQVCKDYKELADDDAK